MKSIGILGVGSYLPEKILTNDDLSKFVDTNDEWIRTRTGIKERRIAAEEEATSDLAYNASLKAIEDAKIDKNEIDLVIVATSTPDYIMPSTAAIVQDKLGISAAAFDQIAACTGFVYSLITAYSFIQAGVYKKVLVIGAEVFSRVIDWKDRSTCVLFGDGAGAVVLGEAEENYGYLSGDLQSDGAGGKLLYIPSSGSRKPFSQEVLDNRDQYVKMNGGEVFKFAVKAIPKTCDKSLESANLTPDDITLFIPHQANSRIIESAAKRYKQPIEKFYMNLDKYANTSAATIPIALDEAVKDGKIVKGNNILLVGFGGGLTYGSCIIKWSK